MILVQRIGMSGYVPLEGLVLLPHFSLEYFLCRYRCKPMHHKYRCRCGRECDSNFHYLFRAELDKAYDFYALNEVVSLAVIKRFDDSIRSIITRDVGLMSGYYCAGSMVPQRLFDLFRIIMGLIDYFDLACIPEISGDREVKFFCSTAWYGYVCLDPDVSCEYGAPIYIRVLKIKNPFPNFRRVDFNLFEEVCIQPCLL